MTLTRELVYGRNATRELYRGPREVLETWVTERASAQIPWLEAGPKPQVKPERLLSEAAGTRDTRASSRGASLTATRTPTSSRGRSRRCSSASTR
jgi:hypothetical protein